MNVFLTIMDRCKIMRKILQVIHTLSNNGLYPHAINGDVELAVAAGGCSP